MQLADIPKKLTNDAIVEAILEVRFDTQAGAVPEMFFGRLAERWPTFSVTQRLPAADIPLQLRSVDPNLRFQPTIEIQAPGARRRIRLGPNVFSFHEFAPYPGWDQEFGPELLRAVDSLVAVIPGMKATRLGLRYINALRSDAHGIAGADALRLDINVSGTELSSSFNLNYKRVFQDELSCMVRIATRDLVEGQIPQNTVLFIAIDMFTSARFQSNDAKTIKDWINRAHKEEKLQFFSLLEPSVIKKLRED